MTTLAGEVALRGAVEAVTLAGRGRFRWLGQDGPRLAAHLARDLDDDAVRTFLVQSLARWLYANFYCRGEASAPVRTAADGRAAHTPFARELIEANAGRDGWRPGGITEAVLPGAARDGVVVVRHGPLLVHAAPGDCDPGPGRALRPGVPVRLRLGRGSLRASPGFYLAVGESDLAGAVPRMRWYWHLAPDAAAPFVRAATARLNAADVPFRLKVLADPLGYRRCDAAVIYTARDRAAALAGQLAGVYAAAGPLRPAVPAFTRRVAPGLAVADDPGGDSFGMHRCRLLAEGLVRAAERGARDTDARLQVIRETFADAQLDPDRPHLQPGHEEIDLGDLPALLATQRLTITEDGGGRRRSGRRNAAGVDWLGAAETIAARITADALWYRDRCRWIGAETTAGSGRPTLTYRTLPDSLYGGTAGVALFLAEFAARTGDAAARRTALAAIRQALRAATRRPTAPPSARALPRRLGLYGGLSGTVLAAARVGLVLHAEEPLERARALARGLLRRAPVGGEHDLISGSAGRVLGVLALGEALDLGPAALAAAEPLGRHLLRSAERTPDGWSWASGELPRTRNLTGLSHGAAGPALALAALWRRTATVPYRDACLAAIGYETHWFNPDASNWPDFRLPPGHRGRSAAVAPRHSVYWCHGAPGIALQRLAVAAAVDEPALTDHAGVAIDTTARAAADALRNHTETFSLCHGLTGNAEVLLAWAEARQDDQCRQIALEVAAEGLARHGADGRWPCGTVTGDTPSLLLGRAGIGHFYLRLAAPDVPSVLLIDPPAWVAPAAT